MPVDCLVEPGDLTIPAVESLEVLEPFGMGNPQPMFCMRGLTIEEITPISQDRHTKLCLLYTSRALECAFVPDFVVYPCVALQLPFVQILKKSLYFYVKMPKEIHCKSVKYTV